MGRPGPTMVSHQPGLPVTGWCWRRMLVTGQRMADKDRIGLVGVQLTIGLVSDLEGAKLAAGVKSLKLVLSAFS